MLVRLDVRVTGKALRVRCQRPPLRRFGSPQKARLQLVPPTHYQLHVRPALANLRLYVTRCSVGPIRRRRTRQ